jgi:hypothetical protein
MALHARRNRVALNVTVVELARARSAILAGLHDIADARIHSWPHATTFQLADADCSVWGHRTICSKLHAKRRQWAGLPRFGSFGGAATAPVSQAMAPGMALQAGPHSRT